LNVVIIEDETAAAEHLKHLLIRIDSNINIHKHIESVREAVNYFSLDHSLDLVFMDIHLADGLSFEIFDQISLTLPVVFTTAFDEYAIKAFKVHSIDYLTKPINEEDLRFSLKKFKKNYSNKKVDLNLQDILDISRLKPVKYRSTFLFNQRDTLTPIDVKDIAYFLIDNGNVKAFCFNATEFKINQKLEEVEKELDPELFFRANRQYIIQKNAIKNLQIHFYGKLVVNLKSSPHEQIIVSREKAPLLKKWMK